MSDAIGELLALRCEFEDEIGSLIREFAAEVHRLSGVKCDERELGHAEWTAHAVLVKLMDAGLDSLMRSSIVPRETIKLPETPQVR